MKKIAILFALSISVAGCQTFGTFTNPLNQSRVDTLNATWGAALALANGYRTSCAQKLIPSSCRAVVADLQIAAVPVQSAVKKARLYAKDPTISATDLIDVASSAVSDYRKLQTSLGVN